MTSGPFRGPYSLDPFQSIVQVNFPALEPVFLDGDTWLSRPTGVICDNNGRNTLSFWFNGAMFAQYLYLFNPTADWETSFKWISTDLTAFAQVSNYDPEVFSVESSRANAAPTPDFSVSDSHWHHVLMSYDTNKPVDEKLFKCYIDDVKIDTSFGWADGTVESPDAPAFFTNISGMRLDLFHNTFYDLYGGTPTTGDKVIAAIAEYWMAPGVYLDLDDVAIRRRFISVDGKPVKLGKNGEKPLIGTEYDGAKPAVYLTGPASKFALNKGTGGAFTVVGEVQDAKTYKPVRLAT